MLVLFIAVALGAGVQTRNGPRFSCIAEPVPGAWSPASEQDIGVYTAPPTTQHKAPPLRVCLCIGCSLCSKCCSLGYRYGHLLPVWISTQMSPFLRGLPLRGHPCLFLSPCVFI